jgi:hypothetical protein
MTVWATHAGATDGVSAGKVRASANPLTWAFAVDRAKGIEAS